MNTLIQKGANGYSWKKATDKERMEFCSIQSQHFTKSEKFTATFLADLNEAFEGNNKNALKIELIKVIGLTVTALALSPLPPSEPPNDK